MKKKLLIFGGAIIFLYWLKHQLGGPHANAAPIATNTGMEKIPPPGSAIAAVN